MFYEVVSQKCYIIVFVYSTYKNSKLKMFKNYVKMSFAQPIEQNNLHMSCLKLLDL